MNKLFKLKLINIKIYNKNQRISNIKLETVEYNLKKAIYMIYKFSLFNKKILFVGASVNMAAKFKLLFNKKTKHVFISELTDFQKDLYKNIDLIVVMKKTKFILSQNNKFKTPIIFLTDNSCKVSNDLFYSIFASIFKKSSIKSRKYSDFKKNKQIQTFL